MLQGKKEGGGEDTDFSNWNKMFSPHTPCFQASIIEMAARLCLPQINNDEERSEKKVNLCAVFLFSAVFQIFPRVNVKCNCSFDLYLLSPQV